MVGSGEPVSVPDNLLKICKAKPVIFKGKPLNPKQGLYIFARDVKIYPTPKRYPFQEGDY